MKTISLQIAVLLAASSAGCAYATSSTNEDGSDPVSAEQALAPHMPVCTKIGTGKEGWRWADTGALIRHEKCAGLTPECQHINTRSEGWYADGLIAYVRCQDIARVHPTGEPCGPSIGYSCDSAHAWCQGLPEPGVIGGSGVCQPFGFCAGDADCASAENAWTHDDVPGTGKCIDSQCTWIREDCHTTADCLEGYTCLGIPSDGSTSFGKCRYCAPIPGDGMACTDQQPCGPGLTCIGLSMGPEGWCQASWMAADYTNGKTVGTTSNVIAYGLATVPVDIVVAAKLNKSDPSKLTLQLTDPNGVPAIVCSPTAGACTTDRLGQGISVVGNSRDDQVNGRWTLQVKGSGAPKIMTWTLHLSSRWD